MTQGLILDLIIIAIFAAGVIGGVSQGFIVQAAGLAGGVVALIAAKLFYNPVRQVLFVGLGHHRWVTAVAYLVVFFVVWFLILAVARKVRTIARFLLLGGVDRLAGAVLGFVEAAVVVELLLFVAKHVQNPTVHKYYAHSKLAEPFLHVVPIIDKLFPHF